MNPLNLVPDSTYKWALNKVIGNSTNNLKAPHPITTIFRLALVKHYDDKTRIYIDENDKIVIQSFTEPEGYLSQSAERTLAWVDHTEIADLAEPIKIAIKWLPPIIDDKIREIFGWAQEGLEKLKVPYLEENKKTAKQKFKTTVEALESYKTQIQTCLNSSSKISALTEITFIESQKNPSIKPLFESALSGFKFEYISLYPQKEEDQDDEKDSKIDERKELFERTIKQVELGLKNKHLDENSQRILLLKIIKNHPSMKAFFVAGLKGLKNKFGPVLDSKDDKEEKPHEKEVTSVKQRNKDKPSNEKKDGNEYKTDELKLFRIHSKLIESVLIDLDNEKKKNQNVEELKKEKNSEELKKALWSESDIEIMYQQLKKLDQFAKDSFESTRPWRISIKNFLDGQDIRYQVIKQEHRY